jgi:hypothetical protein
MVWTILLIILILACFGGGFYGGPAYPYRYGGWGLGTVLLIILIVLLVRGA